ncbi:hypothetical protein DT076_10090 [Desertihabitans brevis]|uniref:DUF559 domain-containing protein n=1 Tax=Desertihabitans brevis TaxID=2268447 RepID=A0A367YXN9_9ACTN|nr:hypothetical protein DT076_10090 [Desertihabitans brevis]
MPQDGATLRGLGITKDMVRSRAWVRTSRGHHRTGGSGPSLPPLQRVLDAAALVPAEGAFTGWAAALLAGVPGLDGRNPFTAEEQPVPICLAGPATRRRPASGVSFSRGRLVGRTVVEVRARDAVGTGTVTIALPVATPAQATIDAMRTAGDLAEAVAFADGCLHAGWVSPVTLHGHLGLIGGGRGVRRLRMALTLVDPASRSAWESRFRLFYQLTAGLPRPRVNVPVFGADEQLLGIADLLDAEAGLVSEFDGQHHRGRRQHRADNEREERFEAAGLTVVRADSLDLLDHAERLVSRLRSGHHRGSTRDRRRDTWTLLEPAWWAGDEPPPPPPGEEAVEAALDAAQRGEPQRAERRRGSPSATTPRPIRSAGRADLPRLG